jgi:cytoskeletal protein RodZ
LKEIGEKLKETRENMGITIEEAAEDLKIRPAQLENIEEGNKDAFKDVFYLKFFIRDYAKYLGLDYEEMVEEFNEFLFDYTSKISLDDIKKANKASKPVKKIASPYTLEGKSQKSIPSFVIYILIFVVVCIIIYCIVLLATSKDNTSNNDIIMNKMEVQYELT